MKKILLFPFALLLSLFAMAQTTGDYRSAVTTGNWNATSTWERFDGVGWMLNPATAPASTDGVISILSGHTVTVNTAVTADQIVVDAGGTLTQTSNLTLANGAGDDLTVNGTWNWQNAIISGPGNAVISAAGILTFATGSTKRPAADITNNGTINWQDGNIDFNDFKTITNNASMTITGNNAMQQAIGGAGIFVNNGTITKTSTGTTQISIPTTNNTGTFNCNAGTVLLINNTFTNTGSLIFNSGTLTLSSNVTFNHNTGSVISGTGNFNNSSTFNLNINQEFPSSLIFVNTGTINGTGNLTINHDFIIQGNIFGAGGFTVVGDITWNFGQLARVLTIDAGRILTLATASDKFFSAAVTNNGTINWLAGQFIFNASTVFTNNATINVSQNTFLSRLTEGTLFVNNGTFTKTSSGTTTFNVNTINNTGTFNCNAGTIVSLLVFNNSGNLSISNSTFNISAGSTFNHNTGSVISGTGNFNNSGTLNLNINQVFPATLVFTNTSTINGAGNLTINHDFTIQGNIFGAGAFTVVGNIIWNSGQLARVLVIDAGRTLTLATTNTKLFFANITNNGTCNWQDGTFRFEGFATVTNNAAMNISGNNNLEHAFPGGIFINNGTITKSSTGTTLLDPTTFNNIGTLTANGGIIQHAVNNFSGTTFNNTGSLILNGSTFNNVGAFNHSTGSVISGTGNFNNTGTINFNINQIFPASIIFSSTSIIAGVGDLTINNDFTIQGNVSGGTLTINANTTWIGTNLSRVFTNQAGRTFTISGAGQKNILSNITNNGTMDWQSGTVRFEDFKTLTNNGTMTISGNNSLEIAFPGGVFVNNGTLTKTSTGTTNLNPIPFTNSSGATMKGLGTMNINGTTFNSNGIIAPGLSPGLLIINGHQPLSANSTLQIEMLNGSGAGTGHDLLERAGNLTLAGTITVTSSVNVPVGTYTIINLTSGTISGSFATVNIPSGTALQINATNVQLIVSTVLPLNLISFSGSKQNNDALLQWKTANEINVSRFEVQRSNDGQIFATIGTVAAGGSLYSLTDANTFSSRTVAFYRLKSIDKDDRFTYSSIIKLSKQTSAAVTVYPNPVKDVLTISGLKQNGTVLLYSAEGKLLQQQTVTAQTMTMDMSNYAKGIYLLQYMVNGEVMNQKIIKQ